MTWFKVDDNFAFHRKVVAAGLPALGLWVRAGAWCAQTLTDGFVPEHMVPALADGDAGTAQSLVRAGLWHPVEGGFAFHQWTEYQPTRASIEARRSVRAAAGRKGGLRSGQVRSGAPSKPEASAKQTLDECLNPRPVPSHIEPLPRGTSEMKTYVDEVVTFVAPAKKSQREPRGIRIPDDFAATPDMVEWARKKTPSVDGRLETEQFIDYWRSKTGKDADKRDWVAAWRYWMRRAQQRSHNGRTNYRSGADLKVAAFEAMADPTPKGLPRGA